jgi:hypothetical protein
MVGRAGAAARRVNRGWTHPFSSATDVRFDADLSDDRGRIVPCLFDRRAGLVREVVRSWAEERR